MIISPYTWSWNTKRLLSTKRRDTARYKEYDYSQGKFIPIHFDRQILPGTFVYSLHPPTQETKVLAVGLHYLIDNEIDLSVFDTRYRNDEMGTPACDPAILLKIIKIRNSVTNRGSLDERKWSFPIFDPAEEADFKKVTFSTGSFVTRPSRREYDWLQQRRNKMGDKGGKKNKEKGQKQKATKQARDLKEKKDKQPKAH